MTFWVVRAGRHGETENYAIENNVVAIGWHEFGDLSSIPDRESLQRHIEAIRPDKSVATIRVWTGELWAFKDRIQIGDWVALPLKQRSAIAIGRIAGPYQYVPDAPQGARHQRRVEWARTDLPRSEVDADLLASLGSTLTVFSVTRNNAEDRLSSLVLGREDAAHRTSAQAEGPISEEPLDLEQVASDQIAGHIQQNFRGHDLARLVGAILLAQGYKIEVSPPGADGGVDIIAGSGPMGFDHPKIAVQVKSGSNVADVSILRELQGVMPRFGADYGLLVSWSGFNNAVVREARQLFFKVRLWDSGDVVNAIQDNYEKLSKEIQAEIPLKRTWLLVEEDE